MASTQNLDGLKLLPVGEGGSLVSFDLAQDQIGISCVRFPPSGLTIALVCGGEIREYSLHSGALVQSAIISSVPITHLEYFVQQNRYVVASEDGLIRIFDSNSHNLRASVTMSRKEKKLCGGIFLHPERPVLFFNRVGSATMHGYDTEARKEVSGRMQAKGKHFSISHSHSKIPIAVTAFEEGGFRVWDLNSLSPIHDFENVQDLDVVVDPQTHRTRSRGVSTANGSATVTTSLHFHPSRRWLLVGDQTGTLSVWSIPDPSQGEPMLLMVKSVSRSPLQSLRFVRDTHDILGVSIRRGVSVWEGPTYESSSIGPPHFAAVVSRPKAAERFYPIDMQKFCDASTEVLFVDCADLSQDVFSVSLKTIGSGKNVRSRVLLEKLTLHNPSVQFTNIPKAVPLTDTHCSRELFSADSLFKCPAHLFFTSKDRLCMYVLAKEKSAHLATLPSAISSRDRAITAISSTKDRRNLIVCTTPRLTGMEPGPRVHFLHNLPNEPQAVALPSEIPFLDAEDGVFVGEDGFGSHELLVVVKGGLQVAIHKFNGATKKFEDEQRWNISTKVSRVFNTPLNSGRCVMYWTGRRLVLSANAFGDIPSVSATATASTNPAAALDDWFSSLGSSTFAAHVPATPIVPAAPLLPVFSGGSFVPHEFFSFPLRRQEVVVAVSWAKLIDTPPPAINDLGVTLSDGEREAACWFVGVVTSQRVVIMTSKLQVVVAKEKPHEGSFSQGVLWATSCMWFGHTLLVGAHQCVYFVTLAGSRPLQPLCSLLQPNSSLCGILADRLLLAVPAYDGSVVLACRPVGMLHPLAVGLLDFWETYQKQNSSQGGLSYDGHELVRDMERIVEKFESSRCSRELLETLANAGMFQLAFQLCNEGGCRVSPHLKFQIALKAKKFSRALEILQERLDAIEFEAIGGGLDLALTSGTAPTHISDGLGSDSVGVVACSSLAGGDVDTAVGALRLAQDKLSLLVAMASVASVNTLRLFVEELHRGKMFEEEMFARCIMDAAGDELDKSDQRTALSKSNELDFQAATLKDVSDPVDIRVYRPDNPSAVTTFVPDLLFENVSQCIGLTNGIGAALGVSGMPLADAIAPCAQFESSASNAQDVNPVSNANSTTFEANFGDFGASQTGTTATAAAASTEPPKTEQLSAQELAKIQFQKAADFSDSDSDFDGELNEPEKPKIRVKFSQAEPTATKVSGADLKAAISAISLVSTLTRPRARSSARNDDDSPKETHKVELDTKPPALTLAPPAPAHLQERTTSNDTTSSAEQPVANSTHESPNAVQNSGVEEQPTPTTASAESPLPAPPASAAQSVLVPSAATQPAVEVVAPAQQQYADETIPSLRAKSFQKLQTGEFAESLFLFKLQIEKLVDSQPHGPPKQEIAWCARYVAALALLEMRQQARLAQPCNPQQIALLSQVLSEIDLNTAHRTVCFEYAISDNMNAENFGVAARIIDFLVPHTNGKIKAELEARLAVCNEHDRSNKHNPPPPNTVRFCPETRKLVSDKHFLICGLCQSVLAHDAVVPATSCCVCKVGPLKVIDRN